MKTYFFNTGVKPWNSSYLGEGEIFINNEKHIPFICDGVPNGARFRFACNDPNASPGAGYIVAPIIAGGLCSKYAYFTAD